MGKKWYHSKTLYANILTAIATLSATFGFDTGLGPAEITAISTGAFVLVNVIMRWITKGPIERSLV